MTIFSKIVFFSALAAANPVMAHKAPAPQPPTPAADSCASDALAYLIGIPAANVPNLESFGRVWFPGSAGTMDFQPQRRNIYVDENGTISRITCG